MRSAVFRGAPLQRFGGYAAAKPALAPAVIAVDVQWHRLWMKAAVRARAIVVAMRMREAKWQLERNSTRA